MSIHLAMKTETLINKNYMSYQCCIYSTIAAKNYFFQERAAIYRDSPIASHTTCTTTTVVPWLLQTPIRDQHYITIL